MPPSQTDHLAIQSGGDVFVDVNDSYVWSGDPPDLWLQSVLPSLALL